MDNGIGLDRNKVIVDLGKLHNIAVSGVLQKLKEIVYHNNVDVFYVLAGRYDNELHEFYFFKKFVEKLKGTFNIFLMLNTKYFPSTKYFDSIFALGVDALTLSFTEKDRGSGKFPETVRYITSLWPSGAVFTDIAAGECTGEKIKEAIAYFSKLKIIPRIMKADRCDLNSSFCLRDYIVREMKENGISFRWVNNFELCGIIQKVDGQKGRSKRKIAGKFAFELASLRRKLMLKEVESSFDSASL